VTRDHFASITTPGGSVVTLHGLTSDEAAAVAREAASDRPAVGRAEGEGTKQCTNCAGKGGWTEKVETTTPSGATVVTERWVSCRPCKGMGTVPARS
jgi:DnaJ-class molecular chaperone